MVVSSIPLMLVLGWVADFRAGILPRHVTGHLGQLILLPAVGLEMSRGKSELRLGIKRQDGTFHLWISV